MDIHIAIVSLRAEDVAAATHFYRDVIGLPLQAHSGEERPHFDLGGTYMTILHGQPAPQPDPKPRFPVAAFSIPDLEAAVEKLRLNGVDLP